MKKCAMARMMLTTMTAMFLAPLATGARAMDDDEAANFPLISTSTLTEIKLPAGARRAMKAGDLENFEAALKKIAETNHGKAGKFEVLVWCGNEAMKTLPARMKEAGYSYTTQSSFDSDAGKVTPMAAVTKEPKEKKNLLGMWIERDSYALLVWGHYTPDNVAKSGKPAAADDEPAPARPVSGSANDLVGSWGWTTIGGITYVDTITRQTSAPSGMAAKFTFTKDGRYKKFFYIRQQTYSLVTQSETNEEGTYTVNNDGTILLKPTKGHYNGNTGSRIIDRDMTQAERKPTTWYWEWRNEDGKKKLYLGPTKDSVKPFKPE